jgi:hypothetical protein
MGVYESCTSCTGKGYFECNACLCPACESRGKIKCSNCQSGKVSCSSCSGGKIPCTYCNATGEKIRKGWVFTHHEVCLLCRGAKEILCQKCKGSASTVCSLCDGSGVLMCSSCQGKRRLAKCDQCSGTQKLPCQACNQRGKVEGQWLKSLGSLPVDRLRFEHEKRQREISNLQIQVNRLSREEDEAYDEYVNGVSYSMDRTLHIANEKVKRQSEISDLEVEIEALERVINLKWQ